MSRFTKRAVVVTAVGGLVASLVSFAGAPGVGAQAQPGDEEVPITVLDAPPAVGTESAGPLTSPGSPGTGATEAGGLAPEATVVSDGTFEGQPLRGESVIGADGRQRVINTTAYPASAIGQIEGFQNSGPNAGGFICTGWLIDSNTILTSGHCAFEGGLNDPIFSAQFFPGRQECDANFQNCIDPFGGCNVNAIFAKSGWRVQGQAKHDWAIMQLDCNIGNTVGTLGYFALPDPNQLDGKTGRVEGYPGDQPFGTTLHGTHWKMSGTMHRNSDANMIRYPIDTAGGQSGSPIMVANRPSCGGPCGMGIHSYGTPLPPNPQLNSGPRITIANFNLISDIAENNGA